MVIVEEHGYGGRRLLRDMSEQAIADDESPYTIEPGQSLAFHSGLGGRSIRRQREDLAGMEHIAAAYTSDQNATYGALFIDFHVDGNPRKARGYFRNIRGEIIDEFEMYNNAPEPEEEEPALPPPGFVYARETELRLDGDSYQFLGFNVYGLANDEAIFACGPSARHGEYPDEYLQALFSTLSRQGVNTLRFWAFQSYTNGGTDFSSLDRVIGYARQYNLKIIPVLENQWADCTEGGRKESAWYADGYNRPYGGYALSYRDYVQRIVPR